MLRRYYYHRIVFASRRDALAPLLAAAGVRTVAANWQVRLTST